jgi:flavodoxin I
MRIIYDAIKDKVKIVGQVPDEGYTYDDSTAVIDGIWVGLPLDEDNEYDLTSQRLQAWVDTLKKEFV